MCRRYAVGSLGDEVGAHRRPRGRQELNTLPRTVKASGITPTWTQLDYTLLRRAMEATLGGW
jgi:hypothetical protein